MSYGLHFNGTNSYCRIPVSVTNASSWELTIDLVTDLNDSYNSRIYRQACIFGYDSGGYKSRDFHIDIQRGNLFIFCGLSGNNNVSQLLCGTLTNDTGDYGWNTSKFIADGGVHTIRVKYEQNKISVYLDRVYLGYLNVTSTINSSALYLGCSQTGEKVYARFDLFNLELKIDDSLTVQYQPTSTTASDRTLVDSSGNNNNGVLTGTFSVVETNAIAVYADTERCVSTPVTLDVDVVRKVNNALYSWYYINPGDASLLSGVTGTTVTGLDASASVTGEAFYQPTQSACFGIAATKEIWIRCDIYTTANYANSDRIRIYSDDANGANGWATNATVSNNYMLVHNGITKTCGTQGDGMFLGAGRRRSVLLHMRSGSSDGLIEFKVATTLGTEYNFSYAGDVNAGNDFANVYIQMDGNNIYVSNVVISNVEISINDGALISNIDAERVISRSVDLLFDAERVFASNTVNAVFDIERKLQNDITVTCDAQRDIVVSVDYYADLSRQITTSITLDADSERELIRTEEFLCDLMRKIPHVITDNSTTLQSVNIIMSEQQLTDNISFIHTGDIDIMDSVDITHLDYHNKCRAEETSTRGILQTCKCASDIDAILYQQMAYAVPESEWEWTPEYLQAIGEYNETHEEQVEKIPSAPASAHITSIAEALGKSVSLHFTDYISTMITEVSSGTNYAGLISELFGWTSRLPQMMINCYLRGDTIYVVQRGQEQHTVTIDSLQLTVHTIQKKIIRTTWGSDPWSKTEVQPYYNDWSEFNQDSYNPSVGPEEDPEESGVTYEDDNLVEETTVKHGSETVVTRYEYQMLPDGKKFLYKETASTYSGGSKVDEVVTIHDPVSNTQSHVYAVDEDGVLGDVLTSSNHDDRVTPYQQMEAISGTGYYENGKYGTVVSDSSGQKYLLYGITYHQDKIDKAKRTINGVTLIDTSFPVDGQAKMEELTQAIMWLDRKTEETVTLDVYNYNHIIDFNDKISWHGHTYHLQSNNVMVSETIVNKQTLTFVRWY